VRKRRSRRPRGGPNGSGGVSSGTASSRRRSPPPAVDALALGLGVQFEVVSWIRRAGSRVALVAVNPALERGRVEEDAGVEPAMSSVPIGATGLGVSAGRSRRRGGRRRRRCRRRRSGPRCRPRQARTAEGPTRHRGVVVEPGDLVARERHEVVGVVEGVGDDRCGRSRRRPARAAASRRSSRRNPRSGVPSIVIGCANGSHTLKKGSPDVRSACKRGAVARTEERPKGATRTREESRSGAYERRSDEAGEA